MLHSSGVRKAEVGGTPTGLLMLLNGYVESKMDSSKPSAFDREPATMSAVKII